ncbi:uncharacterized protein EDB91DRAFT_1097888 [Suillus paluster]|uniref:uncharacterized protein n=1 Tax=Suillus paluster TaxID=48578 RepID=UPI001B861AB6|nr:uncharacterized protein EDB91DRAFT_1097888 [Suillus paluster]KAG1755228.1 hypothetical protein EDB91DRAFT_1097888 [Suillus paluster]
MLCPSVSNFSVDLNIESGDMSTTLQYWSHLSSVSTGELSEAAILHLSNLPSLQYLKFRLPLLPISADTRKLLQRPAFHALRQLDIECDTLELLDTFLETLSIALRVLSITITCQVNTTRALPASISCLSKACAHTSLQQVQINIEDWSFDGDGDAIGAAAFQPLYAMRNLRKLDLDVAVFAHLDDAGLLQMAKAWPLLEEFYFNKTILSLHNVTPNAFVSLLQHCPCLVSVGIAVDWSTIDKHDISPNVPYQGFTHDALSQVFFGASKISHPTRIAAFISAIAPNLESIEAWSPDFHGHDQDFHKYSGRWNLVRYLIKSFSMVREQGRRMILNAGEGTDENVRGPCGCYGVVQPAQETENRETAVGGDIGWGGEGPKEGNGSESDYMPHSEHVSSEEEDEE